MAEVIASVEHAAQWVSRESRPPAEWNPVYRALVDEPGPVPAGAPDAAGLDEAGVDLVLRQLTAPALLVVAVTDGEVTDSELTDGQVTDGERTRRLRIGLDPAGATVERAEGDRPSRWTEIDVQAVPATITALLEDAGVDLAPPQLAVQHSEDALRLTPEQNRLAHAALARGLPAEEAFASVPDLDDSLRDALTATGPRLSLALTLHDPHGRVTQEPVTWSRLWARGSRGLYRLDQPTTPALEVHPVLGGDVLGTLLPVLEQGLRFAAACAVSDDAPGGAR
ncbi:MAG: hypothetical protein ACTHV2_00890 [Brachybacterium sp.]|nr:hypothetical protein [Brachybacterium sp.]MDN6302157.1 hypothetical protein [Brachybacterium sp.]